MKQSKKVYYYFNGDGTLGYVSEAKKIILIKNFGWKEEDFVLREKIDELFNIKSK